MLTINIKGKELWDENRQEFLNCKDTVLTLEHSLVSVSKWESKWHKPFISKEQKTKEETLDYIKCMTLTQNVDPIVYYFLSEENIKEINAYIEDKRTATWFNDTNPDGSKKTPSRRSSEMVTSELIYYWMVSYQIPFECQKWHLNRLLTLIRICNVKNQDPKKQSKKEVLSNNAALNAARRKKLGTSG